MRTFLMRVEDGTVQGRLTWFTENMLGAMLKQVIATTEMNIEFTVSECTVIVDRIPLQGVEVRVQQTAQVFTPPKTDMTGPIST